MSMPFEHDYIGLSEAPAMESPEKMSSSSSSTLTEEDGGGKGGGLKYRETELRLGPPGSESPERKVEKAAVAKNLMLGAKRGFSDAIDGPGKWVLSGGGGGSGEVEVGKGGVLFSPRGGKGTAGVEVSVSQSKQAAPAGKDAGSLAAKAKTAQEKKPQIASTANDHGAAPASKAQVVGWPPIRSFRKNTMASCSKNNEDADSKYVKVSMDGAPYLRKVDLKNYGNYKDLSSALEKMFSCFTIGQYGSHGVAGRDGLNESRLMDLLHGSEYVLTYEDKDEDWMLVGDVPWEMFTDSCKRLRIMKSTEAIGLAPRAMEKCKNRN